MTRHVIGTFAVLVALLACSGCKKAPVDQGANAAAERYIYRLKDSLHLALGPLELEAVPIDKAALRAKFPNPRPPTAGFIQHFHFFVPGEIALKDPERYHKLAPMNQIDENVVRVTFLEPWTTEMIQNSPATARDARVFWQYRFEGRLARDERPEEIIGMQCLRDPPSTRRWPRRDCLAERANGEWAFFTIYEEGSTLPFPTLSTNYFTKAYGGLTIEWSAHTKHAAKWREIDEKLWRLIDQWNVATANNAK
jgi:hypothetical protein